MVTYKVVKSESNYIKRTARSRYASTDTLMYV